MLFVVDPLSSPDPHALDLHKWLHIPFEAGCALVRSEKAHRATFSLTPEYLVHETRGVAGGSVGRGRGLGRAGSERGVAAGSGAMVSRARRKSSRLRCSSAEIWACSTGMTLASKAKPERKKTKARAARTVRS